jgi:hypothetical protein
MPNRASQPFHARFRAEPLPDKLSLSLLRGLLMLRGNTRNCFVEWKGKTRRKDYYQE